MSKTMTGATAQATKPTPAAVPQAAMLAPLTTVPMEKVARRAYEKWLKGGCKHGCDQQHWYEAEMELRSEMKNTGATTRRR